MTIRMCIFAAFCLLAATAAAAGPQSEAARTQTAAASDATRRPVAQTPKAAAALKGIRTIDAINIEGEIAVPQVLFITSRDNRRYRDGLGKNFRMGTLDVARSLATPNRLCVAGKNGESLKEE